MSTQKPQTPLDWIIDRILRGVIGSALLLPFPVRVRLVGGLVSRVIGPIAGYDARAMANLHRVYPEKSPEVLKAIARGALRNAGCTLIENYSTEDLRAQVKHLPIQGPGLDAVRAAQKAGQPVIFVTGHFGNYEVPRHALDAVGIPVGGLYRPMSNAFFNDHYVRTMERVSGPLFEQGRGGTRGFIKHLRSGGMAVLLFDLYESKGTDVPFLSVPSRTSLSSAELALKFGALVVPYFGLRTENGFEVTVEAPIAEADPATMLQEMHRRLEARIAAHPEQWLWIHRRWKNLD